MSEHQADHILSLTGNPISGLKLLAQIGHESGRLGRLEKGGKAKISKAKVNSDTQPPLL